MPCVITRFHCSEIGFILFYREFISPYFGKTYSRSTRRRRCGHSRPSPFDYSPSLLFLPPFFFLSIFLSKFTNVPLVFGTQNCPTARATRRCALRLCLWPGKSEQFLRNFVTIRITKEHCFEELKSGDKFGHKERKVEFERVTTHRYDEQNFFFYEELMKFVLFDKLEDMIHRKIKSETLNL